MRRPRRRRGAPRLVEDLTASLAPFVFMAHGPKPGVHKVRRFEKATYPNGDVVCVLEIA